MNLFDKIFRKKKVVGSKSIEEKLREATACDDASGREIIDNNREKLEAAQNGCLGIYSECGAVGAIVISSSSLVYSHSYTCKRT